MFKGFFQVLILTWGPQIWSLWSLGGNERFKCRAETIWVPVQVTLAYLCNQATDPCTPQALEAGEWAIYIPAIEQTLKVGPGQDLWQLDSSCHQHPQVA